MNTSEFISLLQQPSGITASQTRALSAIVEEYPYFQTAAAMQLKGLKDSNSFSYNKELKRAAALTVDRTVLFEYITSKDFKQNEIANKLQSREDYLKNITVFEPEEVITQKSVAIDDAIKMKLKEAQQVLDADLFEEHKSTDSKETLAEAKAETSAQHQDTRTSEEKLKLGQPLDFNVDESHSFSEWLKLTSTKPIDRKGLSEEGNSLSNEETKDVVQDEDRTKKFELIDNFIANNPKIVPKPDVPKPDLSNTLATSQESLMTATLARVYLEQKNYKKAIQAYKILILKYPEKSSFFADQIQDIKSLIEKH